MYRDEGYLPPRSSTIWPCSVGARAGMRRSCRARRSSSSSASKMCSHSPAFFDVKKLRHMNGEYIRTLSAERVHPRECSRGCALEHRRGARATASQPGAKTSSPLRCTPRSLHSSKSASPPSAKCPPWSSSSFSTSRNDETAFAKVITNDPLGRSLLRDAIERYERSRTGMRRRCTKSYNSSVTRLVLPYVKRRPRFAVR